MEVTRDAVLKAIAIFDAMGPDEFFRQYEVSLAKSYFIRHEDQEYDMKAVVRVARGQIGQEIAGPLAKSNEVARRLKALGFKIAHLNARDARASREGRRRWYTQERAERDSSLAREAKERNREDNGGWIKCEACGFRDKKPAMFDAHHLLPLEAGERKSGVDDFAVLCPTCHRWSHQKAKDRLRPLTVEQVRRGRL